MNWEWLLAFVSLIASVWMFTSNPPRSFWSVLGLVFTIMGAIRITVWALLA